MTRYSKTMSEALEEVREASARADAKRAMSKDKDMKQNPFSKDDDATDDDVKAASKNIIMQLRKSVSMKGNHAVEFSDGKKKIDPKFAQAAMDKFMRIRRPDDKLKFQNKLAKSYKDLLKALKEQYEMVEVKEDYVCEDCGCPQGNADPNCSCPNDSTDLQASYWVKKESVDEEFELDEMKMNDPKLLKMFDKLKKGSKIKLKTSSTISKGKDYVEYIVKSKNTVNKGKVEKITLATVGNEGAVKKFLYKRDGTVGFAIGDMGASIDDIKEDFTPHMMYDPKTGKGYKADKEADHLRMKDMGYTHEKPDVKEAKFSDDMINKLKKAYEPMKGKKIPPGPLMKIFDKIDSNEDGLKQLYKADIPFVSVMAMSRLMLRHNYKATDINKLGKISREDFVLDEAKGKPNDKLEINIPYGMTPEEENALQFDKFRIMQYSFPNSRGIQVPQWIGTRKNLQGMILDVMSKARAKKVFKFVGPYEARLFEEVELGEMAYKPGSFKDIRPQEKAAKAFDKLIQSGGLDKKDYQKARQLYVQASDAASREKLKKFIYNLDTEPTEAIMDLIGKNDPDTFNKMYPKSKPGEYLSSISYNHRNVKSEEVELDEMKEPFVVIDTADGDKVVATASDEKGAKSSIATSQLPPMKIKDKKTLKIVKVKKKQMIGYPIKEEPDNRPDSAKEVEQGRDDKKKTRIAQLQLQIAKATETINKLNTQEKQ